MSDWKLKIYHAMPPSIRNVVASVRGMQLHRWRYGPETEQLVEEALDRDKWSQNQWKSYQESRLEIILYRAATHVPFYRQMWEERRRRGDRCSWNYIENWPILEKSFLQQNPHAFIADDYNIRNMFHEHTSGTTGTPLELWWSQDMVRLWYALFEARLRSWFGITRFDNWAILGGQLVIPVTQQKPPFWVWNRGLNQLYMSTYHISPESIPSYLAEMTKRNVKYLHCYPSAAYALARISYSEISNPKLRVIVTNAEPLFHYQRDVISQFFQCPINESYGMAEAVTASSECECGTMHLWPEVGWIEVLNQGNPTQGNEVGDLICTGLMNEGMPLIRYRVGDRGAMENIDSGVCQCGRRLPRVRQIDGRCDDTVYTFDGRQIGRLDPVFKSAKGIQEAQIVQEELSRFRVRYVLLSGDQHEVEYAIEKELRSRLGDIQITFELVRKIPRTSNGKFRAVINEIADKAALVEV